jgi:hypothetical protein
VVYSFQALWPKFLYFSSPSMRATYPAHIILRDLINVTILRRSSICIVLKCIKHDWG